MTSWIIANVLGIATGVVLKTLVPMPWIDDPIRRAWRGAKNMVKGWFGR